MFASSLPTALQALAEAALGLFLGQLAGQLAPPQTTAQALRTPAARAALRNALLAALQEVAERRDQPLEPLFDEQFLRHGGVDRLVADFLLTPRDPAGLAAAFRTAWRNQHADPDTAPPIDPTLELFLATLPGHLRGYPEFRALLDSATLDQAAATLETLAGQAADDGRRLADLERQLARLQEQLAAALLLRHPPAPAAGQLQLARRPGAQTPGVRPAQLGEIGFLSQCLLAVPTAAGTLLCVGSRDGVIHAFGLAANRWRWHTPLPAGYQTPEAFAVWRDRVLVAPQTMEFLSPAKDLLLLDLHGGEIVRRIPLPARQYGAPAVEGDMAYLVGSDGVLYALDLATPANGDPVRWTLALDLALSPFPPALAGDRLVLPANDAFLRCVDLTARGVTWTAPPAGTAVGHTAHFMATPLVHDGVVYAANWNGVLFCIDLDTGRERWRYEVPERPDRQRTLGCTPVLAGDLVLVSSYDHRVHAVRRRDGRGVWTSPDLERRLYSRPAVAGEGADAVVFAAPFRRTLHTLRLADGQPAAPPAELTERARGDFLLVDDTLVVPGRDGALQLVGVELPVTQAAVDELLAQGDWPAAALALVRAGRPAEAARVYADHELYFSAGQLFAEAGDPAAAAACYAHSGQPEALRRAAGIYQALEQPRAAAPIFAQLGDWPAAAQAWEAAQEWAQAAMVYEAQLGEPVRAAQLFIRAGQLERAANLYAAHENFTAAIDLLEQAGAAQHEARINELYEKSIRGGNREHLNARLARAKTPEARARLYEQADEWTSAAEEWLAAGCWRDAVELLLAHERVDHAIDILRNQPGRAEQLRAAALLCAAERWSQALPVYEAWQDWLGQAACHRGLGHPQQSAALYERKAAETERPRPGPVLGAELADLFAQAALLYRQAHQRPRYLACLRKARYYQERPWLTPTFTWERPLLAGERLRNVVKVTVTNDSTGLARDVTVELVDEDGAVRFTGFRPFPGIAPLSAESQLVTLRAREHGDILVRVLLHWTDPDGSRKTVSVPTWVAPIQAESGGSAPGIVYAGGDVYFGSEVIHGDQYRDHAYRQEGDRVDIRRGGGREPEAPGDEPAAGRRCPECGVRNASAAAFCDGCGADLRALRRGE